MIQRSQVLRVRATKQIIDVAVIRPHTISVDIITLISEND
jgi:hypothetical protein